MKLHVGTHCTQTRAQLPRTRYHSTCNEMPDKENSRFKSSRPHPINKRFGLEQKTLKTRAKHVSLNVWFTIKRIVCQQGNMMHSMRSERKEKTSTRQKNPTSKFQLCRLYCALLSDDTGSDATCLSSAVVFHRQHERCSATHAFHRSCFTGHVTETIRSWKNARVPSAANKNATKHRAACQEFGFQSMIRFW